eukprot:TRINITY_DN30303_c0_g1_i1.p1 TRINITY_DN30303_c0_g1~~TRINITY_DN30303_c0_g1_i1.p1  ORF type:complete len:271 (+),score=34.63 TRINITY_DN30303_c0_g1_i1:73-885(+)
MRLSLPAQPAARISRVQRCMLCHMPPDAFGTILRVLGDVRTVSMAELVCLSWYQVSCKDDSLWRYFSPSWRELPAADGRSLRSQTLARFELLAGCTCVLTGFSPDEAARLRQVVLACSGKVHLQLNSRTTHLISGSSLTLRSRQGVRMPGLWVVSRSFVDRSWRTGGRVAPSECSLPPLLGCTICITGFSNSVRQNLERLVQSHGGKFSWELNARCTHLIADKMVGAKVDWAVSHKVPIVNPHWLYDAILKSSPPVEHLSLIQSPSPRDS